MASFFRYRFRIYRHATDIITIINVALHCSSRTTASSVNKMDFLHVSQIWTLFYFNFSYQMIHSIQVFVVKTIWNYFVCIFVIVHIRGLAIVITDV